MTDAKDPVGLPLPAAAGAPHVHADSGWFTRERLLTLALLAVTVLLAYLCYLLILPFMPALCWALALAIVVHPAYDWMARRLPHQDLAAFLGVVLVALLLLAPIVVVTRQLMAEANSGISKLRAARDSGEINALADRYPRFRPALQWAEEQFTSPQDYPRWFERFQSGGQRFLSNSISVITQLFMMLFILFFFLRDRRGAIRALRTITPLSPRERDAVFERVYDTIYATVYGTIMVRMIQGALGGLIFWILGLPAPLLWGLVMGILSIVPVLGAFVVWIPAALYLLATGEIVKAVVLTLWGMFVIGFIDNLLYPFFVGQRLRLHTLPVFLAMFGGLTAFGASGIIIGPVILAVMIAVFDIWRRRVAHGHSADEAI